MPVDSKCPEFVEVEKDWNQIADNIAGERVVKAAKTKYLPRPNAHDESEENSERYKSYVARAVFHNVTARTVSNMVGQCFSVDPVATIPDQMQPWEADIDGAGMSTIQQSKKALAFLLSFSRAALWVDYPKTSAPVSIAQAEEGGIRPKAILLDPRKVINWRVTQKGAKSQLSLVVIEEDYISKDDGFEAEKEKQYRVLRLAPVGYYQEIWRSKEGNWGMESRTIPIDGAGLPLKEIPFKFLGVEANDPFVEKPLMLDISNLNMAHYRNSADYEEMVFMGGQPTAWISGLDDGWVQRHMPNGVFLGSRALLPLPKEGAAGLLQVDPNTLCKEAMDQKEALMQALGAKLVEKREVAQTATEKGIDEASEASILAAACNNVSAAYSWAFRIFAQYGNIEVADPEKEILYELNTEFAISRMTPEEQGATLNLYNGKLITFEEARDKLKSGGVAYLDDEEAKDEMDEQAEKDFENAQREFEAQEKAKGVQPITDPKAKPPIPEA
jgi:hypothetical protein